MPEPISAVATAAGEQVAKAVLNRLGAKLAQGLASLTQGVRDRLVVSFRRGFETYLETSYNKCKFFKTTINPNEPLEVAQHYVHVNLTCSKTKLIDDCLIQSLSDLRYVVITGLAGSGKSMFMRYLTVRSFESQSETIPLFIELRHMNALARRDLLTFIRTSCSSKMKGITEEQFNLALQAGAFLLILDGFDELNHEIRGDIQRQIFAVRKDFPQTEIVLSSRLDQRFNSWAEFHVYTVDEFAKEQTVKLVESLPYDSGVKRRFIREVNSRLYQSHQSFLSSPLLATIMLLTFEAFAEIPQKMHTFYSQAFDTLFQKHDAQKDQFQRQTHSGLPLDEFKTCFAAFCAISYGKEQYSFDQEALLKTARDALQYCEKAKKELGRSQRSASRLGAARRANAVAPQDFVADLQESVCMLQPDGVMVSFVHRSFQEYFASRFVTGLHGAKIAKILDVYSRRPGDSVIPMLHDMYREPMELEWILPTICKLDDMLSISEKSGELAATFAKFVPEILIGVKNVMSFEVGDCLQLLHTILALYSRDTSEMALLRPILGLTREGFSKIIFDDRFSTDPRAKDLRKMLSNTGPSFPDYIRISAEDEWWFEELGMRWEFSDTRSRLASIRREIEKRSQQRDLILSEIL